MNSALQSERTEATEIYSPRLPGSAASVYSASKMFGFNCPFLMLGGVIIVRFDWQPLVSYSRKYWKLWAGVLLAAAGALNRCFGWVEPQTAATIALVAGGLGISLHHRGDPLPPLPPRFPRR